MKKLLFAALAATALMAQTAAPKATASVKLMRLDCGTVAANDLDQFSDTRAYVGQSKRLTASCYLIKHGDSYMLWDTGLPAAMKGKPIDPKAPMDATVTATLVEQLAQVGIKPEQISMIGISHYHFDHIGQAAAFPGATLLIGKGDFDALKAGEPGTSKLPLAPWIDGTAKSVPVSGDKDVFGDGSVTMLDLPGHTPGHHGLLVHLAGRGNVLLSGDVAHFRENYDSDGVPGFNTNRADSLAALGRFKGLAKNLKATVIIQHDPRDIAKLPAFPNWAE
ncbi:N-acyl homoserine lactonase family protein [Sphingomonas sp.]|uniref:N-acyl homoserine lactonase family protein n=1 Tax=Sphingomonas sp. TaxID=28214 RepID=UPI00333E876B